MMKYFTTLCCIASEKVDGNDREIPVLLHVQGWPIKSQAQAPAQCKDSEAEGKLLYAPSLCNLLLSQKNAPCSVCAQAAPAENDRQPQENVLEIGIDEYQDYEQRM